MPIFESIRAAELAAEAKREDARRQAQAVLADAEAVARKKVAAIQAEAEAAIAVLAADVRRKAETERERMIREGEARDRADAELAANNRAEALSTLMKKVTGA